MAARLNYCPGEGRWSSDEQHVKRKEIPDPVWEHSQRKRPRKTQLNDLKGEMTYA